MSDNTEKCIHCKRIIWSRQRISRCSLCKSPIHTKCLRNLISTFPTPLNPYYCGQCFSEILPFQNISDLDFSTIFRDSLRDIIHRFNYLDAFVEESCSTYIISSATRGSGNVSEHPLLYLQTHPPCLRILD